MTSCNVEPKPGNDRLAMRTDLFDFELPADNIALRPAKPRDSAKMLVVQPGGLLLDRVVAELPQWLKPGATADRKTTERRRPETIFPMQSATCLRNG